MIVGVPKEIKDNEKRVSLTPSGARDLIRSGAKVNIEKNAGLGSGFSDTLYLDAGASILENAKKVFECSELILKVKEPQPSEVKMLNDSHTLFTFFHFAADESLTKSCQVSGATCIAYETVQNLDGSLPILIPMSEVAGRMAVQNGAKCLEGNMGGKGKLLGGVPGVSPSKVTILGGGIVGTNAAKMAAGLGADVSILDINMDRLRYLDDVMDKNITTVYSNTHNISSQIKKSDLIIGAVLIAGKKAPNLITKDMLKDMSKGSVIVDVAVDQGGCVETCKPTTHKDPTFVVDDILHYCVSNMPGAVPHTSTLALTNITLPYISSIVSLGVEKALAADNSLLNGLNMYKKHITHEGVASTFNIDYVDPSELIQIDT